MKLREYLILNGMTATAFAEKAGLSVSTVTRSINGDRRPQWDTLAKIRVATAGKVSPNDFVDEAAA